MIAARPLVTLALVATQVLSACAEGASESVRPADNLILISLDTLRADRVGAYGNPRGITPELDRLAARGAVFERVVSESNWTLPAHVTMLSGLAPDTHGVVTRELGVGADTTLLAETLARSGFRTLGKTDGGNMSKRHGFDRGFELFLDDKDGLEHTLSDARAFVERLGEGERYFLFLHSYDVHCPYEASEETRAQFESPGASFVETEGRCGDPHYNEARLDAAQALFVSDVYDAGIREADELLGAFFAWLDERGEFERTLVVVTSDHGEEFLEHGRIGHAGTVYREALLVPLILAGPGIEPIHVATSAGLMDVAPTVLELLGLPALDGVDGTSLVPLLSGGALLDRDEARFSACHAAELASVMTPEHHLIVDRRSGNAQLYAVENDSKEQHDLSAVERDEVARLRALLEEERAAAVGRSREPRPLEGLSDDALEELRALGYVE